MLAERVKAARYARGWSQADLARRAGMSRGAIAHVEAAYSDLTVGNLCAVARALGVRPGFLLDGGRA
jgi:transcriptional regulator with XRE-family HTH domain